MRARGKKNAQGIEASEEQSGHAMPFDHWTHEI